MEQILQDLGVELWQWVLSQVFGAIGLGLAIWAMQIKTKPKMLLLMGTAGGFLTLSVLFLFNWVVFFVTLAASIRNLFFAFFAKREAEGRAISRRLTFCMMLVFMAMAAVPVFFFAERAMDYIILSAGLFIAYGNWHPADRGGVHILRVSCGIYDAVVITSHVLFFNVIGIISHSLIFGSFLFFYFRWFFLNKRNANEANSES